MFEEDSLGVRKLMVIRRDSMSEQGLRHWTKHLRPKVKRYVFRCLGVRHVPYSAFRDRGVFVEWLQESFGPYGYFYIFSWRRGYYRNKSWLRPRKLAVIELREGMPPNFVDLSPIARYKWWEPDKKSRFKWFKHKESINRIEEVTL